MRDGKAREIAASASGVADRAISEAREANLVARGARDIARDTRDLICTMMDLKRKERTDGTAALRLVRLMLDPDVVYVPECEKFVRARRPPMKGRDCYPLAVVYDKDGVEEARHRIGDGEYELHEAIQDAFTKMVKGNDDE